MGPPLGGRSGSSLRQSLRGLPLGGHSRASFGRSQWDLPWVVTPLGGHFITLSNFWFSCPNGICCTSNSVVYRNTNKSFWILFECIYRPQRSWAKVIFSQACVCPQGGKGVCLSACWDVPPWEQTPPRSRHPPREADSSIRSTSGRYASYWNAFLFIQSFSVNLKSKV